MDSVYFCILPKIFPNLNVVAHLVVLAGWGPYPPMLVIFTGYISNLFIALLVKYHFKVCVIKFNTHFWLLCSY